MIAVLARAFYARQDTRTPVAAAVGAVAINCTLAVVLVGPLGLPGIALAIAIAAWIEALVLLAILYRRLHHFELRGLGRVGVESVVGSVVAGVAAYAVLELVRGLLGTEPGSPRPDRRGGDRERGLRGRLRRRRRSPCGSRNCRLSSGSWPTSSAARSGRDGRRARGLGPLRRGAATRAPTSSSAAGPTSRPSTAGRRTGSRPAWPAPTPIGAQILVRRPRPMPWGFAYAPRGPVAGAWDAATLGAFTDGRPRRPAGDGRSRVATSGSTPRSRPTDRSTPTARCARRSRRAGWRPAPPIQPNATRIIDLRADEDALWGDLRKKWRQYVNKARTGGIVVVDAERRPARRVLPDLPRDGRPGRLPDPHRSRPIATSGTRSRPTGRRPAPVRPDRRRRAAGHAVPRPLRAAGRRAVRRDDRRRRRVAGELPAQVGGDPLVARAGRHELRPVGPRDRRDRPFQDRLRRSRGPLHRRLGPRPRPARAAAPTSVAQRAPCRLGAPARRASPTAASAAAYGAAPIERPRRGRRRARRLGRA